MTGPMLEVRDLHVQIASGSGLVRAVDGVSFEVVKGDALGLVGESGSGKSVSTLALLGLLPSHSSSVTGSAVFAGQELIGTPDRQLRSVRGAKVGMVFQDPLVSLNPVLTIGRQITETVRTHLGLSRAAADQRAVELLDLVGIAAPARRVHAYPHELSAGMRQRAMIAIALSCQPDLLIADEPTTALDVTVQAQILEVLDELRRRRGMAVLLITHDLGIVAGRADRVAVMYAGQIVEEATTADLFARPSHPYTQGLFASVPRITGPVQRLTPIRGTVPPPTAWPDGCRFRPRCPQAFEKSELPPELLPVGPDHRMRCWLAEGKAP